MIREDKGLMLHYSYNIMTAPLLSQQGLNTQRQRQSRSRFAGSETVPNLFRFPVVRTGFFWVGIGANQVAYHR